MLPTNWGRSQALAVISPRKQNGRDHAAEAVAGLHHRMNYLGLKMLSWADLLFKVWNCGATSRNRHELDYIIHYDPDCGDEVSQVLRGNVMGYEYILRGYVSQGQARHAYKSFCDTKFCDKSLNAELLEEEVKIGAKKGKSKIV